MPHTKRARVAYLCRICSQDCPIEQQSTAYSVMAVSAGSISSVAYTHVLFTVGLCYFQCTALAVFSANTVL